MASTDDRSQFVLPSDQAIVKLKVEDAFNSLSDDEKMYSHYLSQASWYGGFIVLFQTSPESPDIFLLLHSINTAETIENLKKNVQELGLTKEEFTAYLLYCSGVYGNMGNYKGFGDSKFIPDLEVEQFEKIVFCSKAVEENAELKDVWFRIKAPMYSLSNRDKQLGLGSKGVTKYFSANCDDADADRVNDFFKYKNLEGYINRVIKTEESGVIVYEIRHAAVFDSIICQEDFKGCRFKITTGDYAALLEKVIINLAEAIKYASNELEKNMLANYIDSFRHGCLEKHKDGSRFWIKNKGPIVETYIGFIENYRDPVGMRGEFEGFVAIVNKKMSEKFQLLVDKAEDLLKHLPWPEQFEKDKFLRPDFTSLEVLTFAGSMVPSGINIPNYDEIRQSEGFKNVSLGNSLLANHGVRGKSPFVSFEDNELLTKYYVASHEVQVGLHELLGHGSGKLFMRDGDGRLNYNDTVTDPLTGELVNSCYGPGETYDSKFTTIASSYEECRAECAGLHLCLVPGVNQIFGYSSDQADDLNYINYLSMALNGIKALVMYSVASQEWKQAHSRARFVIVNVFLQAGQAFLKIDQVRGEDGKPDLLITMDKTKLRSVAAPAIANFLRKLQVYKSSGNDAAARIMYEEYSKVSNTGVYPWLTYRDIAVARKKAKVILVQGNTKLHNGKVLLTEYEENPEGMVESWRERFAEVSTLSSLFKAVSSAEGKHW